MVDAQIRTEVLQILDDFSLGQQREALELLKSLRSASGERGSGKELVKLAGSISEEDGLLMERVIEESCERIDPRDWELPR